MRVEAQPVEGGGPTQTDEALIDSFYGGDAAAYEEIDRRYRRKLYHAAIKHGLPEDEADACANESLTKVWLTRRKKLLSLAGAYDQRQAAFGTWLYSIHTRTCIDALRRRNESVRRFVSSAADDDDGDGLAPALERLPSPDKPPDQLLEDEELKHHLTAALESLPPDARAVIGLYYGLGNKTVEEADPLTMQQVGVLLGTSPPTVYRKLRRVLAMLKQALIDRGVITTPPPGAFPEEKR